MSRSFFLLFLTIQFTSAQNLVPNPSFEGYSSPFCGLFIPGDFNSSVNNWQTPTFGSPDAYYTSISSDCYNFQPNSTYPGVIGLKGSQLPRTGEAMVGLGTHSIPGLNQREYVQVELISPLTVGFYYVVDFYVSLADSVEFSSDAIGAFFSNGAINATNDNVLNYTPQIAHTNGFIADYSGWTLISDTLYAQDAFTHLTIGNFNNDVATNTQVNPNASGSVGTYGSYYYIDDVRVEEVRGLSTNSNTTKNTFAIYPNPVKDFVSVEFDGEISEGDIQLTNQIGQTVSIQPMTINTGKINFSTQHLANGIYVLMVQKNGRTYTQKMVVQH